MRRLRVCVWPEEPKQAPRLRDRAGGDRPWQEAEHTDLPPTERRAERRLVLGQGHALRRLWQLRAGARPNIRREEQDRAAARRAGLLGGAQAERQSAGAPPELKQLDQTSLKLPHGRIERRLGRLDRLRLALERAGQALGAEQAQKGLALGLDVDPTPRRLAEQVHPRAALRVEHQPQQASLRLPLARDHALTQRGPRPARLLLWRAGLRAMFIERDQTAASSVVAVSASEGV